MDNNQNSELENGSAISIFIDKLLEEKGASEMGVEVMAQMKKDLEVRLEDRINAVVLENIPPSKLEEFNSLLDEGEQQGIDAFYKRNIPDMNNIIAKAFMDFRSLYIS